MTEFEVARYWEERYRGGGTSGAGSRGTEAEEKVRIIQNVIDNYGIRSVLDLGCGDGYVASRIRVERYVGFDVSPTAVYSCSRLANRKGASFTTEKPVPGEEFDLVMSLDVMFHLVTERNYGRHLSALFGPLFPGPEPWRKYTLVYGTNHDERGAPHVLHRRWLPDLPEEWRLAAVWNVKSDPRKGAWLMERVG